MIHLLLDQTNMNKDKSEYLKHYAKLDKSMRKGHSLFTNVPERDCKEASIPEFICSCTSMENISIEDAIVKEGAQFLIDYINKNLLKKFSNVCTELTLLKINNAKKFLKQEKYSIIFETLPNKAIFDGIFALSSKVLNKTTTTITTNSIISNKYSVIGKLSRLNFYGSTANCINDHFLRNYCYCEKQKTNKNFSQYIRFEYKYLFS